MRSPTAVMAVAALLLLLVSLAAAADKEELDLKRMEELQRQVIADFEAGKKGRERSEAETRRVFTEWKATHGKKYGSAGEEERRYGYFKEFLREIDLHEAAFGRHAFFGIDRPFSDFSPEEWDNISTDQLTHGSFAMHIKKPGLRRIKDN